MSGSPNGTVSHPDSSSGFPNNLSEMDACTSRVDDTASSLSKVSETGNLPGPNLGEAERVRLLLVQAGGRVTWAA
jgi:hypothetical protein